MPKHLARPPAPSPEECGLDGDLEKLRGGKWHDIWEVLTIFQRGSSGGGSLG